MSNKAIPGKARHADSAIELLQQISAFSWLVSALREFCDSGFAERLVFMDCKNCDAGGINNRLHLYSLQPLALFVDLCFEIFHFILFTFQFAFLQAEGEARLQKV